MSPVLGLTIGLLRTAGLWLVKACPKDKDNSLAKSLQQLFGKCGNIEGNGACHMRLIRGCAWGFEAEG